MTVPGEDDPLPLPHGFADVHARYLRAAFELGLLPGLEVPPSRSARLVLREAVAARTRRIPGASATRLRIESFAHISRHAARELWRRSKGRPHAHSLQFVPGDTPVVSIVIPVFNQLDITIDCLSALRNADCEPTFEVIVVDDASDDVTSHYLASVPGLRYVRNDTNVGFLRSCNIGAGLASGRILVLLNNDTLVHRNWLAPLVDRLDDPAIGLVGSCLLNEDGTVQEAGGAVFSDGSAAHVYRGCRSQAFEVAFTRDVDYCSGASIALDRSLFLDLEGFDRRYEPAYYEDVDLAFKVRQRGLRVVYEPRSMVVHLEGRTNGRNLNHGVKRYQRINQSVFAKKWRDELSYHRGPLRVGERVPVSGRTPRRALVLDCWVPRWDMDAGSLRMRHIVSLLQDMGYMVTLWPQDGFAAEPYTRTLQSDGVEVVYGATFGAFMAERQGEYELVVLSRAQVAPHFIDLSRGAQPNATIVFDTVDLLHRRLKREALLKDDPELLRKAELWRDVEIGLTTMTDATLAVTAVEAQALREQVPQVNIAVVPTVHEPILEGPPASRRRGLIFVGGYDHQPNVDAVEWFTHDVLPLLSRSLTSDVMLSVVGSNPPPSLRHLESRNVRVVGYVPDLKPYYDEARVFVCPLRFGAGAKGKIGDAVRHGLPLVTTSIGAEGMHLVDNESCLIADGADDFANAVEKLYTDDELWQRLRIGAAAIVETHFGRTAARAGLESVVASSGLRGRRHLPIGVSSHA